MPVDFSQFHFLRPEWFLALIPVAILLAWLRFEKTAQGDWHNVIPEHLLKHIIHEQPGGSSTQALSLLALLWLLSVLALAGPTWQKIPQPVYEKVEARVYVLDLTFSMYASDLKPDRITRARLKLIDLLKSKREGLSALVVFSGDAHVVTPLTNDTNTIISLVSSLEPAMMPDAGSNASAGIRKALELLANTKVENGRIILISDEVTDPEIAGVNALMSDSPYSLSILGVGTPEGAPIKLPSGQFFKQNNQIIVPQLNESSLATLAENHQGRYVRITGNDDDVETLNGDGLDSNNKARERQQQFDIWIESGQWLMFPILLIAALAFRKGWILSLLVFSTLSLQSPETLYAQEIKQPETQNNSSLLSQLEKGIAPWFLTGDQRGLSSFRAQKYHEAAKLFNNQDWKASSLFYSGQFAQASELFQADPEQPKDTQSSTWYNKANALAFAGDLDGALNAYDQALSLNPDNEDAAFNKELVEQLKEQQKQQEKEQQQKQSQDSDNKQDEQQGKSQEQEQEREQQSGQGNQQNQNNKQEGKNQDSQNNSSSENKTDQNSGQDSEQQEQTSESDAESQQDDNKDSNSEENQSNDDGQQQGEDKKEQEAEQQSQQNRSEAASSSQEGEQAEPLSPEEREAQQALEQWLRQVPDDPSGLLRRKFELEFQRNQSRDESDQQVW